MTAITDSRLARLRDLAFSPKGEATQWAHEFDAELRAVQDDLTAWRETESEIAAIQAESDGDDDLLAQPPPTAAPVGQVSNLSDSDRFKLTDAGADLLNAKLPDSLNPDARTPAALADSAEESRLLAEVRRLTQKLKAAERIGRAADMVMQMCIALSEGDWLPPDYLAGKFGDFANVIDRAQCESAEIAGQ